LCAKLSTTHDSSTRRELKTGAIVVV
jgi:hypothetical protein